MRIFAGVRWRGASNKGGVVEITIFASFAHHGNCRHLLNFHMQGYNYYTVIFNRLVAFR